MDKESYKHTYTFLKIHHLVYHDILWYLRCCLCKGVKNTGLREKLHSVNSQKEQTTAQVMFHFIHTNIMIQNQFKGTLKTVLYKL